MKHRRAVFIILISLFAITFRQSCLEAGEPGELVKGVILNETSLNDIEDIHERKARQWDMISSAINFEMISQRVMGEYWEGCSYEKKCEFVELFTNHLRNSYVKRKHDLFGKEIISLREKQFNNFARVKTILLVRYGKEVSTDFYLLHENGEWKIYDLVVEGVSLVNNYHSQITKTIVRTSYEELLNIIRRKQDKEFFLTEESLLASDQSIELVE